MATGPQDTSGYSRLPQATLATPVGVPSPTPWYTRLLWCRPCLLVGIHQATTCYSEATTAICVPQGMLGNSRLLYCDFHSSKYFRLLLVTSGCRRLLWCRRFVLLSITFGYSRLLWQQRFAFFGILLDTLSYPGLVCPSVHSRLVLNRRFVVLGVI